ncbi:hypothetical protein KI387_002784, partial [Taxus chinensis]
GSINLITKALANVGCKMEVVPDPTTVHYHLPGGLSICVHRELEEFLVCFIVSKVKALRTLMINAGMVLCDRHFGGINYPIGGIGGIAKNLTKGLVDNGEIILYKVNVTTIILENEKAVGVRLSDGREFYAKKIISNATRWDTFGRLLRVEEFLKEEQNFQSLYVKAPSFLFIHVGIKESVLPLGTDCHHFILE